MIRSLVAPVILAEPVADHFSSYESSFFDRRSASWVSRKGT